MIDWTKVLVISDDDIVGVAAGQVVLFASGVQGPAGTTDFNELKNKPELGAMAAEDDAPSDDGYYVRHNGEWISLTDLDSEGF